MVGLVFVSHSRALAEALVGLVSQVTATEIPIAVAAGVGPARQDFGTDASELSAQVLSAESSQDSRKLAQDFFQEHLQDNMP